MSAKGGPEWTHKTCASQYLRKDRQHKIVESKQGKGRKKKALGGSAKEENRLGNSPVPNLQSDNLPLMSATQQPDGKRTKRD